MNNEINIKGDLAKKASYELSLLSSDEKNAALFAMADSIIAAKDDILSANQIDVDTSAKKGANASILDRLTLNEKRIRAIADGIISVAALADPIGEVMQMVKRPNGLVIGQKRVPIGTIGIIYEARPNVTADAAALCLKTSNSVILRGGSAAINSSIAIVKALKEGLKKVKIHEGAINLIEDTSRQSATDLMRANDYLDLLIPRGGASLIKSVVENATVPVIETGTGNCHIYVDKSANFAMATDIIINAKTSRPSVCNAAESLLIHKDVADNYLPTVVDALIGCGVEVRGCQKCLDMCPSIKLATEEDFKTEYVDLIISVKIVDNIDEAIKHINNYSTKHSEAIVTQDYNSSQLFLDRVDSAAVYVNASTRFTDGFEFGFGAEIGISTQKIHARGPMGLKELTSTKYIIYGNGQIK